MASSRCQWRVIALKLASHNRRHCVSHSDARYTPKPLKCMDQKVSGGEGGIHHHFPHFTDQSAYLATRIGSSFAHLVRSLSHSPPKKLIPLPSPRPHNRFTTAPGRADRDRYGSGGVGGALSVGGVTDRRCVKAAGTDWVRRLQWRIRTGLRNRSRAKRSR